MINGAILRDAMISASNTLSNVKQEVDALNVFPVPDGDTGTNMSMTIGNAARELSRLTDPTATEVADVASAALLRGARGNSGVILSLLFRGFSKGLKGKDEADGADLAQARSLLAQMNLVGTPFSGQLPAAQLHWIIADRTGAITVESVADGLKIYDNPVGVLTNNPPFDTQMFQLNNYMHLSPRQPQNLFSDELELQAYSRGMGALGLPGDLSSTSRFVRVAFTKLHAVSAEDEESSVGQFFHILGSVEQPRGCCEVSEGAYEITIYTSCWNADQGIYYYTTYTNHQITAVDMHREELDDKDIICYPMLGKEQIWWEN